MDNVYMCVANGYKKADGKPYSRYARIVTIKKDGHQIQFLDEKAQIYTDTIDKIGTFKKVTYNMTAV